MSKSIKNEENSSIGNRGLVFLLASAGYLDAQAAELSGQLDGHGFVHHGFAVLDSLSSSYSMFRYFFEVFISNTNDAVLMHEIMSSPQGIIGITMEALFLISFSFFASYFEKTEKNKSVLNREEWIKLSIVRAWPYFRDVMKGMKNAYRGWKTAAQIIGVLGGLDLKFLFVPVGLALGLVASANRIWVRSMENRRKEMMEKNASLLESIRSHEPILFQENICDRYFKAILYQSPEERVQAFCARALGGFIDSFYLYAGLLSLAALSPPAFIAMAIISSLYTVTCIIARLYEEYEGQLKLQATQTRCELLLAYKMLELTLNKTESEREGMKKEPLELIQDFERLHQLLKKQSTYSYATAAFFGIRQGLFAYGVLASFLFMASAVFFITSAVFPPILLIACIASGLVLISGITLYTTRTHYLSLRKQKEEDGTSLKFLSDMKERITKHLDNPLLDSNFKSALEKAVNPKPPKPFYFQDWLEVLRSFFSGLSKGSNFALFVTTPFHDLDASGSNSSSTIMFLLRLAGAAVFSTILALRALARGKDLQKFYDKKPKVAETKGFDEAQISKTTEESPNPPSNSSPRAPSPSLSPLIHRSIFNKESTLRTSSSPALDTAPPVVSFT